MNPSKKLVTVLTIVLVVATAPLGRCGSPPLIRLDGAATGYNSGVCQQAGFLICPCDAPSGGTQWKVEPYFPQPGDILLYDDLNKFNAFMFKVIGTAPPVHAAIVVARPNGAPALLEVGASSRFLVLTRVYIVDVLPRLAAYPGVIDVRRPRQPLNADQCAALTDFALGQEGKRFAIGRFALQITPFRARCGIRKQLFGRTDFDRRRWICSENVVAGATIAGLLDPKVHFANCMYPRDLAYDEEYDISATYHKPVRWVKDPPVAIDGRNVEINGK